MNYTFYFSVIWENLDVLLAGAWLTLKISVLAIAFGLIISILGSLCRTSDNKILIAIAHNQKGIELLHRDSQILY